MAKSNETEPEKKLFPGLSLDKILGEIGKELGHQAQMGASELGKAILHEQDGFVLYQRDGKDDPQPDQGPQHGLPDHTQQHEMER